MSALPTPDPLPPNARRDTVTQFRVAYGTALDEARVSEAHTATLGWQALYAHQRLEASKARLKLVTGIRAAAEDIELVGPNEVNEKTLKELAKSALELRERCEHFDVTTITPVRDAARKCEEIITLYREQASREELAAPLHDAGLVDLMRMAIDEMPRVRWDEQSGRVHVMEPRS